VKNRIGPEYDVTKIILFNLLYSQGSSDEEKLTALFNLFMHEETPG